ncbi:MAG: nitrous oxide reductase family maturation protein NosD [Acidobacteria bacterium]|nr:nitrous oxide reductase family maturation protein NosD [Acidobacteriota bacterium]
MSGARLALVIVGLLSGARLEAHTWTVGGRTADFPLIAPALAAAGDGDVIVVRAGVYREDLVLYRSVTIVGDGMPLLIGTGSGTIIEVRAPGCEIRGLAIEGSGTGAANTMDAAIHLKSSGNRILDNRMRRVFYGIVVIGASDNEIAGNDILGLDDLPFGRRGDGIYLYRAPDNRLVRNRVAGMRDGIYFQYAARGIADGNVVERCRYGLHDMFSNAARIEGNILRDCSVGANVMNSTGVTLRGNRFERNRGISAVGLSFKQCDRSRVEDNLLLNNARGALVDGSSLNRFAGNRFVANDTAVVAFASAEGNVFVDNTFAANWSDVVVSGNASVTRWSESGRGNRWDRYRGFDFDGNGVGETPHPLVGPFEKLEGNQPAVRLLLHSPAAAALALAAPLDVTTAGAIDGAPLTGRKDAAGLGAATGAMVGRNSAQALIAIVILLLLVGGNLRGVRACFR